MSNNTARFRTLCQDVRFRLDDPNKSEHAPGQGLADFLAQIRMHGLRVTPTTTPILFQSLGRVTEALQLDEPPEVYVVNDPRANASAPAFGLRTRPVMVLNSGLVELLTPAEMEFAMGHELGHLGLGHGGQAERFQSEFEALQARSQQRYQEVSADRVGLLATRSVFTAAHVMVKLASGLRGDSVALDIEAFLSQLDRDPAEMSREWELHQSHPALPLRLWALLRFGVTSEYAQLSGAGEGGERLADIEQEIVDRFATLGDGRLDEIEQKFFHLALTWLGMMLVLHDEKVTPQEREALIELVGDEHANKAIRFFDSNGQQAVEKKLREALIRIQTTSQMLKQRFIESFHSFACSLGVEPEKTNAWEPLTEILGEGAVSSLLPRTGFHRPT